MIFLVDINLPDDFSALEKDSFLFVKNISLTLPDTVIWDMALANSYTILTRDKDFYYKSLQVKKQIPGIVLFRLGNVKNKELFRYFLQHRDAMERLLKTHSLLVAWPGEIQVVI